MANYLRNRTIQVQGTQKTPFELWTGHAPDISKLRVPFCKVWFHIKTDDKLEPRAIEGVFVGYDSSKNHYSVMALRDRKIYRVTNPIFLENRRGFLSAEPGERDLETEPAFQLAYGNVPRMTTGGIRDIEPKDHGGFDKQIKIDNGRNDGVHGSEDRRGADNLHDSQSPLGDEIEPHELPDHDLPAGEPPLPQDLEITHTPTTQEPRRSGRIRQPTQKAIESRETEEVYGGKPRAQRRREERETVKDSSQ